ncbi:hypothetical protein H5410_012868 [Solanum commersonii]|uniref:DUF4283 domain-containing protein n=1 Tax=Solanum commersonii TaxID=4109 RepID=A0A9J6ATV4_SOLCO|nr:hypothetical protein H5410_012868 [Solanum commersonii]
MLSWLRRREDTIEERNCSCHRNKGKTKSLETEPDMSQQNIAIQLCGGVPIKQLKEAAGTQRRLDMTHATAMNMPWLLITLDDSPTIVAIARFIGNQSSYAYKSIIYYHKDGHFILKSHSICDRDEIVLSGAHIINNKPVTVKPWVLISDSMMKY